jgi:hypothetical protein
MPTGVYNHGPIPQLVRLKMSLAHKGKVFSAEHRRNLSLSMIGRKRSENSLRLQSERQKGKPSPMKGKKHKPESLEKLRTSLRGRTYSSEYKEKMRQTMIRTNAVARLRTGNPVWNKGIKGVHKYARKGSDHPFWKGGITPELLKIRGSIEYELWRNSVYARDNWTCQKYKIKGGVLNAHHILNFKSHPDLRLAIDNGITLSKRAHNEFHIKYGNNKNTREQLEEFLATPPVDNN